MRLHPLRGAIFESFVCAEIVKAIHHLDVPARLYFWRDLRGNEVDFILDFANRITAIEVKSTASLGSHLLQGLLRFQELNPEMNMRKALIHGGKMAPYFRQGNGIYGWQGWI